MLASRADATGSTEKCVFVFLLSLRVVKVTFTRSHEVTFVNVRKAWNRQAVAWQG